MSDQAHGQHGPSWYKIFVIVLMFFYVMFLLVASRCRLSLASPDAAFNSALCLAYGILSLVTMIFGIMICLVGIEHAKRNRKNRGFYFSMIIAFFVLGLVFLYAKFILT